MDRKSLMWKLKRKSIDRIVVDYQVAATPIKGVANDKDEDTSEYRD
jgi:hypothetical protein